MAQPILTDLSYKGLIRVSGPDAVAFLQGQFSTDIEKLTPDVSQLTSWSNAKGRVVAILRVFRRGDDIYLALPGSMKAAVLKKLSMYVLRSKVTLADAGDELVSLALIGKEADGLLIQAGIPVPEQVNHLTTMGSVQAIRSYGEPRYFVYGPTVELTALKARWVSDTTPGSEDAWALGKILAGEPTIYPETSEHFVAQMLDLEQLGAIDFKKGCYIGQEVIARAHYRGGVKRHLARAVCQGAVTLKPGDEIHAQGSSVAEVVDAQRDETGTWQMLAVVQDDFRNSALVHATSGVPVRLI